MPRFAGYGNQVGEGVGSTADTWLRMQMHRDLLEARQRADKIKGLTHKPTSSCNHQHPPTASEAHNCHSVFAAGTALHAPLRTSAPEISPSDRRPLFCYARVQSREARHATEVRYTRMADPRNDAWQLRLRHDGYAHFCGLSPAALIAAARAAIDADLSHQLRPDAADRIRPPAV
jgi:hypothetical protein